MSKLEGLSLKAVDMKNIAVEASAKVEKYDQKLQEKEMQIRDLENQIEEFKDQIKMNISKSGENEKNIEKFDGQNDQKTFENLRYQNSHLKEFMNVM